MKQLYVRSWSDEITSGHSGYIYSERIDPGHILHVHNCFVYTAEAEDNDEVRIGIVNGGQNTKIRAKTLDTPQMGMSALNDFFLGEGDRVFGYFANADLNDTIELHIVGVLYSLDEWRKMTE